MINSGWGSSPPSVLEKMEARRGMRQKWKKNYASEREASYTCKEKMRGRLKGETQERYRRAGKREKQRKSER